MTQYWSKDVLAPSNRECRRRRMSSLAPEATWLHPSKQIRVSLFSSFCPLTKHYLLKHWAVRWEVTLIASLHLPSPARFPPSLSHHALSHFLSSMFSLLLFLLLWHFGLLMWMEERSLVDPCCHSYQTHTRIAAGNHPKYIPAEAESLYVHQGTSVLFFSSVPPCSTRDSFINAIDQRI